MDADAQVSQLEAALLHQAETLVREQRQNTEAARARILQESAEGLRVAEEREVALAKAEAERKVLRQVQAAEARLAADVDRLRWALTEAALAGVREAFQQLVRRRQTLSGCAGSLARRRRPGIAARRSGG